MKLKHTAQPGSALAFICEHVCELRVNDCIQIKRDLLEEVPPLYHNDTLFTPAHRVCENIIGSVYTISMRIIPESGDAVFCRYEDTGVRRYSSPDDAIRKEILDAKREARKAMKK